MCSYSNYVGVEAKYCEENGVPLLLTLNEDGTVKLKDIRKKSEEVTIYENISRTSEHSSS